MENTGGGLFLPYIQFDAGLASSPALMLSAGGGPPRPVTLDTGSLGIVIPRTAVGPHAVPMPDAPPAPRSGSGDRYHGEWFLAPVRVSGGDGTGFTTCKPVPVFGATADGGGPLAADSPPGVMGVGIRGLDRDFWNLWNPFLNLPEMETGEFSTGFILSRRGVIFGYSDCALDDFHTFPTNCAHDDRQLTPLARVTLSPPAGSPVEPYTCTVPFLLDTGLGTMVITPPDGQAPPDPAFANPDQDLVPAVDVTVELQTQAGDWRTFWNFNSAGCSRRPDAPAAVRLGAPGSFGMGSAGRHLLAHCDYLVDLQFGHRGASGIVGLRSAAGA